MLDEVVSTHKRYELINDDLHKFKVLEKAEKKRMKDILRNEDNGRN